MEILESLKNQYEFLEKSRKGFGNLFLEKGTNPVKGRIKIAKQFMRQNSVS